MSFAVRPIKGRRSWEYLGVGAATPGATLNFPTTAADGDLAVCVYVHTKGSPVLPNDWSWIYPYDSIPRHCYLVCAGGESFVAKPDSGTGGGAVMLFRPHGGKARFVRQYFDSPPAVRSVQSGDSASLVIGACATASNATPSLTVPAGYVTAYAGKPNGVSQATLHGGFKFAAPSIAENYKLDLPAGTPRQVIGVFDIGLG